MLKVFCDFCNKQITGKGFDVQIQGYNEKQEIIFKESLNVCSECMNSKFPEKSQSKG